MRRHLVKDGADNLMVSKLVQLLVQAIQADVAAGDVQLAQIQITRALRLRLRRLRHHCRFNMLRGCSAVMCSLLLGLRFQQVTQRGGHLRTAIIRGSGLRCGHVRTMMRRASLNSLHHLVDYIYVPSGERCSERQLHHGQGVGTNCIH
jgi:hypothetical protein